MKTETITVIIPCFNEEEALPVNFTGVGYGSDYGYCSLF